MNNVRRLNQILPTNKNSGFTLIELAIVIVIIGLVVGGVLVGRDLIENSRNRSQVAQLEKLNVGLNSFRLKYNALPGDMRSPAQFGFYTAGGAVAYIHQGDGNINDYLNNVPVQYVWGDAYAFFIHLSEAKFIDGEYSFQSGTVNYCLNNNYNKQHPKLKVGEGGILPTTYSGAVYWFLGLNQCRLGNTLYGVMSDVSTGGVLTPANSYYIDHKLDDGKPGVGSVIAVTGTNGTLDTTDGNCVASSATIYNTTKASNDCRLYVKISY